MTLEIEGPARQAPGLDADIIRRTRPTIPTGCAVLLGQQATTTRNSAALFRWYGLGVFACEEDLSHNPPGALPDAVASGKEPFIVIGAIAGG